MLDVRVLCSVLAGQVRLMSKSNQEQVIRRVAKAGLVYVNSIEEGITRHRQGKGFAYKTRSKISVASERVRKRIESLVIPPAWSDVIVCPKSNGHIQAVGTDEAGRKQYIYHERWEAISNASKFDRLHLFGKLLPKVRRRVRNDLNQKALSSARVLAAVIRLMDKAHTRVGNREYAESNGSHGATTLLADHVQVQKTRVMLDFPGKSGQQHEVEFVDEKVAKVIRQCEEIEGQYLFSYLDEDNEPRPITSTDVNHALHQLSNEAITAKDFRTWWGSVIAFCELESVAEDDSKTERKRKMSAAITVTSEELGNTKAVCRSSYIHPGLLSAAESGDLIRLVRGLPTKAKPEMTIGETRFLTLLPKLDFT